MEKAIAKHLGEKDLHPGARQQRNVHALRSQHIDLRYRYAMHALHGHHIQRTPVPVHLGYRQHRRVREVATQLTGIGRFAHQIQFVMQVACEFRHHFTRLEARTIGEQSLHQPGRGIHQGQIAPDDRQQSGTDDLHRHFQAVMFAAGIAQRGEMHLRHRGAGHRIAFEVREQGLDRLVEGALDFAPRQRAVKRRHLILQPRQLVGDIGGQQIAPGR